MQKQVVVHHLDWFTRALLLFLGCVLLGFLLKPIIEPKPAVGGEEQRIKVDLNIEKIAGEQLQLYGKQGDRYIPLRVDNNGSLEVFVSE
jgi:hypothetical protein